MRWKIIIVNAAIVAIVGLLSFFILSTELHDILADPAAGRQNAERALDAANAQLALSGLRVERYLAAEANSESVRGVFDAGTVSARGEGASIEAKNVAARVKSALSGVSLSLVLFIDARGVSLGRNDSNQMRGENLGRVYPTIMRALESGQTSSDIWLDLRRGEQMLASYAPVRGDAGQIAGLLVAATPLSDGLLTSLSERTSGRGLLIAVEANGALEIIAKGGPDVAAVIPTLDQRAQAGALKSLAAGFTILDVEGGALTVGAGPLASVGGSRAVILAAVPTSLASTSSLLLPVLGVCGLGLVLVVVAGIVLGNHISRPVAQMEEGLLAIINGKTDLRFELEHPDLGGLVFRINSLLNALMGVPETDEEGRTSQAPGPYEDP